MTALLPKDRRFTLPETLATCLAIAGVEAFDLDVAAERANYCALKWCGPRDWPDDWRQWDDATRKAQGRHVGLDGLSSTWFGHVWCNPPYSDVGPWVAKAWEEMRAARCFSVTMLLPSGREEQAWWQEHVEPWRDQDLDSDNRLTTHFLPGRPRFGRPGDPTCQRPKNRRPKTGAVVLHWWRVPNWGAP